MQAPSVDRFGEQFAEAQAGDDAAVLELVDDFFDPLTAFFERRGAHDPQSSANDAIERAIRHGDPDRIDSSPAFRAFLYAIARNQAKNEFRSRERRVTIDLVEEPAALPWRTAPSAESVVFENVAAQDLLSQVKPDQAEVLELRFLEGFTVKETAELVGKSVPAVNALQRRGLARLRQVVGTVLAVLLVWVGIRVVLAPADPRPVISDDHQSEIGELPTENEDVLEDGAPLIVDVEGVTEVNTEDDPTTTEAPAGTVDEEAVEISATLQAKLLQDLIDGQFDGRSVTTTTSVVLEIAAAQRTSNSLPAATTTLPIQPIVNLPAEATEDTPEAEVAPWIAAVGETVELPINLPDPLRRPPASPVPEAVAPAIIDEQPETGATTSISPDPEQPGAATTQASTTTTTAAPSTTTALVVPVETTTPETSETSTSILPDALSDPIGDAYGALKSIVSEPFSWLDDSADAIDISN